MKMKKVFGDKFIVVTGAYGFIGSCVVRCLNDIGYESNLIVVDDCYDDDRWLNLCGKKYCELLSKTEFVDWFKKHSDEVEAVLHFGAISETDNPKRELYYQWNYRFTLDIARTALENDIRFIYASSAATYGDGTNGFSDDHSLIDTFLPLNMYGYSKQVFDQWVVREGVLDSVVGLKFFNVYGANEYHKGNMASRVMHMHKEILDTGKVRLFASDHPDYKNGEQQRDFVYVKDVAALILRFLENNLSGIYNIGYGMPRSWNDMARAVFKAMDRPENIEYFSMPEKYKGKYQYYTCAEMTKCKSAYPDFKFTSLEEGVQDYVVQYLAKGERW